MTSVTWDRELDQDGSVHEALLGTYVTRSIVTLTHHSIIVASSTEQDGGNYLAFSSRWKRKKCEGRV